MTDTYIFLIREHDWDSDSALPDSGSVDGPGGQHAADFTEHEAFQSAVAELGARIVSASALQNAKYGGVVTPGKGERKVADAVHTDSPYADSSELITGYYEVEVEDEALARQVAALVPTDGTVEWRKVFPTP
jgi:hypothetical protein